MSRGSAATCSDRRPGLAVREGCWDSAVRLLASTDEVALACHLHPDGDALGSMLALGLGLQRLGKRVVASFCEGTDDDAPSRHPAAAVPPTYRMLPGQQLLVPPAEFPTAPPVLVTLDTSSRERLGSLEPVVDAAGAVLVVDHHALGSGFGSHHLVDSRAAATAVVVEELLRRLGVPLTADLATCLYTGVTTDTGSFKYAATTPAVHELAARLLATGIRHDLISRRIWDTNPLGYVRLLGGALVRAELDPAAAGGLGFVWTTTTAEELLDHGLTMPEIEGVIDVLRTVDTSEVAAVLKGDHDGTIKVSTRSKGRVDVGAVCADLGGGGHRFAAGFTSYDDAETTVAKLRSRLDEAPHLPT